MSHQRRHVPGSVGVSPAPSTINLMTVTIELSDEVLRRLEAAAHARGISVEELATQTLSQVPVVDSDFAAIVTDTISQHREILDRLAAT